MRRRGNAGRGKSWAVELQKKVCFNWQGNCQAVVVASLGLSVLLSNGDNNRVHLCYVWRKEESTKAPHLRTGSEDTSSIKREAGEGEEEAGILQVSSLHLANPTVGTIGTPR